MNKFAQYFHGQPAPDAFDESLTKMLGPVSTAVGLAGAYFGGKHLWKGSPELRAAAMLGLPAALYKYMRYRDPMNMVKAQTESTKDFYEQLQKDPNSMYHSPEVINQVQQLKSNKIRDDYASPMRSALRGALPAFALGAALPTALRIMMR